MFQSPNTWFEKQIFRHINLSGSSVTGILTYKLNHSMYFLQL